MEDVLHTLRERSTVIETSLADVIRKTPSSREKQFTEAPRLLTEVGEASLYTTHRGGGGFIISIKVILMIYILLTEGGRVHYILLTEVGEGSLYTTHRGGRVHYILLTEGGRVHYILLTEVGRVHYILLTEGGGFIIYY